MIQLKTLLKFSLLILAPCAMFQPLGMDIFISGIPFMVDNLHVTEQKIQYILIAFMLASGLPQLFIGKLSDIYGRRPLMIIATCGFAITSYMCARTHTIYLLTCFRFLQGLSAATSFVVAYAIIRDLYSGHQAAKTYSYITCILALSAMLAPFVGNLLMLHYHTWESTFYFLTCFALITVMLTFYGLPETRVKQEHLEKSNALMGFSKIIKERIFWTFTSCITTVMTGLFLYFSLGSILLMDRLALSSSTYSIVFGMNACFFLTGNYVSSLLLNKASLRKIVVLGNAFVLTGSFFMLLSGQMFGLNVLYIILTNAVITFGGGLMTGPATSAALEPFGRCSGTASGILGACQYGIPAFIGLFVTRFEINSLLPLAGPILILSCINVYLLMRLKHQTPYQKNLQA
jgi:MFS transporter, DHA1 family, multidrug resistance protein